MYFKLKNKNKSPKISMDELMIKRWETIQNKGKKKYVWIDGGIKIGIGLPTFIVLIDLLIGDNIYQTVSELLKDYFSNIIFYSIAGISYKTFYWNFLKKENLKMRNPNVTDKIDFCYYCGTMIGDSLICPECGKNLELLNSVKIKKR